MATYILVHGAWHGGWCYRDTAAALRAKGHTVFTPTLTGTGERFHQSHECITLETHIRDIAGVIEAEELENVILLGHSYGGMVITGLADRLPEKLAALVYLDAFVPEHGESLISLINVALAPEVGAQFLGAFRGTALEGHCGLMQPIPAEAFNIAERNQAWVNRRCRPQALATFEMPVLLSGGIEKVKRRLYILADGWDPSPFRHFATKVQGKPGWELAKLPCSHDVMVDMPGELAELLIGLA
jgi:pimeloyl-ACP methyl ester carboxylesterase